VSAGIWPELVGEASLLMAKQINPKATPYNRGEDELRVS